MMKWILVASVAAAALIAPAADAGDRVKYVWNDEEVRLDIGSLKTAEVCVVKKIIAEKTELKLKKFDLLNNVGTKMRQGKTLYDEYVRFDSKLRIKEVSSSYQCR